MTLKGGYRHNQRRVLAAKNCSPYVLKKMKSFQSETEAIHEEKRLKKMKSRIYLEGLINGDW